MKAWIVPAGSTSGADALRQLDRPTPKPAHGEIRVAMKAWSINFRDLGVAAGRYFGGPVKRDIVPLSDGAGVIDGVGPGVTQWKVGDRVTGTFFQNWSGGPFNADVAASALGGALDGVLAEQVVLSNDGVVRVPDSLSFEEAACLPCAGLTAWSALFEAGSVGPGQTVLVLGTGGVSLFVLQFAKTAGARVIVTSSSNEKLERASALGADLSVNYRSNPYWDEEILKLTGGRGVDLVVEVGGAGTLPRSLNAARPGGTVAVIGVVAGGGEINPVPLIPKALRMQGIYVGHRSGFEAMNAAIEHHNIRPVIDKRIGFANAPDAWRALPTGAHFGKIVITN
jgi:NADPH:quinone reductase-like Zn-dependent oxidoreductase